MMSLSFYTVRNQLHAYIKFIKLHTYLCTEYYMQYIAENVSHMIQGPNVQGPRGTKQEQ